MNLGAVVCGSLSYFVRLHVNHLSGCNDASIYRYMSHEVGMMLPLVSMLSRHEKSHIVFLVYMSHEVGCSSTRVGEGNSLPSVRSNL